MVYTRRCSSRKNLSAKVATCVWISTHMSQMAAFSSGLPRSSDSRKRRATLDSASAGQGVNQSMVQQLMREGNWRQRTRREAPTGDMASTMCRLSRTRCTNRRHTLSLVSGSPAATAAGRRSSTILDTSSAANMPGTSPVLSTLDTSSRKASCTICVSPNRKARGLPATPVVTIIFLMSSRNSLSP